MSYMSLEIPTFWKMTAFLFTPPTYLLGFPGPCARPQAIGWNGHQSQGNQGLKDRGFDGRFPLQFVNFGDKLRWMLSIYGDTFMAKHSTSICQWSWFSIDSLPTSRILALTLESWQNMPWKVQLVSKNSTTTTTATRYIRWMMHPTKKRPQNSTSLPQLPIWKVSCVFFRMRGQNWQMVVVKDFSVHETGLQLQAQYRDTVLFYSFTFEYSGSQPCPMFIHSHTFFPLPCKQKEKYCKYLCNYIQHLTRCLAFWFLKRPTPSALRSEGHESPAGLLKGWRMWQKIVHMIFYDRSFNHWNAIFSYAVLKFIHSCPVSYQGRLCGNWPQTISRPSIFLWRLVSKSPCVLALVFFPLELSEGVFNVKLLVWLHDG